MRLNYESGLLGPVATYMRRKGFRFQYPELPFYEYSIDLYAYSQLKNLTVAVELKLYDWHRAFEQALLYQLCSDWVFVAMPKRSFERIDLALLARHRIGLLTVSDLGRCHQRLAPAYSKVVRSQYRNEYIEILKKVNSCPRRKCA